MLLTQVGFVPAPSVYWSTAVPVELSSLLEFKASLSSAFEKASIDHIVFTISQVAQDILSIITMEKFRLVIVEDCVAEC